MQLCIISFFSFFKNEFCCSKAGKRNPSDKSVNKTNHAIQWFMWWVALATFRTNLTYRKPFRLDRRPLLLIFQWRFYIFSVLYISHRKLPLDTLRAEPLLFLFALILEKFYPELACLAGGSGCACETFCGEAAKSLAGELDSSPFSSRPARLFALASGTEVRADTHSRRLRRLTLNWCWVAFEHLAQVL